MPDRTTLSRLGRLVADDVAAGQPGPNSEAAARFLEAQPEAALELLNLLLAEAGKSRRNERLVTAYGHMLGQALEHANPPSRAGSRRRRRCWTPCASACSRPAGRGGSSRPCS